MVTMRREIPIAEAKARFAECVRGAERGHEVVLTRHGRPVARLVGLGPGRDRTASGDGWRAGTRPAGEVREVEAAHEAQGRSAVARRGRLEALERLLQREIWPRVPEALLGKGVGKREREEILGLGEAEA